MKEYIEREALKADLQESYEGLKNIYKVLKHDEERRIAEAQLAVITEAILRVKDAPAADPIREMGGCYCWECEEEDKGHCRKLRGIPTIQIGFCGYGRRREDGGKKLKEE